MRKLIIVWCAALCAGLATVTSAHRLANGDYVTVSELRQRFDLGHGGTDSGTRGAHVREKEMTLALAKQLELILTAHGFQVHLTRTTDHTVALEKRAEFCRRVKADLFVSLHFNAGGAAEGIETYCLTTEGVASTARTRSNSHTGGHSAGNQFDEANVWLAHCVQRALIGDTQAEDRGVRRARFEVLRDASCPAVLVEGGFLSNAGEEQKVLRADYREKLAHAIAEGIVSYQEHNHGGSHE